MAATKGRTNTMVPVSMRELLQQQSTRAPCSACQPVTAHADQDMPTWVGCCAVAGVRSSCSVCAFRRSHDRQRGAVNSACASNFREGKCPRCERATYRSAMEHTRHQREARRYLSCRGWRCACDGVRARKVPTRVQFWHRVRNTHSAPRCGRALDMFDAGGSGNGEMRHAHRRLDTREHDRKSPLTGSCSTALHAAYRGRGRGVAPANVAGGPASGTSDREGEPRRQSGGGGGGAVCAGALTTPDDGGSGAYRARHAPSRPDTREHHRKPALTWNCSFWWRRWRR